MIDFDITMIRKSFVNMYNINFDERYTFYYDETNNIRKFYVRKEDFNSSFTSNFILGGVLHEGDVPNIDPLIKSLKLQKTVKEIKFKHIAKGDFLSCLKSEKLRLFLQFIRDSKLYIHYTSLNFLYWAIVDIVDSAIANSKISQQLGFQFSNHLKNDLYKLSKLEIDSVIELFYRFKYPNIKEESILLFIEALISIFDDYIDTYEFHFGLESLRQILKESKKINSLPFIMYENDYILVKDLSQFYLKSIYLFKYSTHIFDNEDSIIEILKNYRILDKSIEIKNYLFVDSKKHQLIQLSDIFVGLMGKLTFYLNTSTREDIDKDFSYLSKKQEENIDLLIDLFYKSDNKNKGFLHSFDSEEETSKINIIYIKRNKFNV
jgi:hypothetical protein